MFRLHSQIYQVKIKAIVKNTEESPFALQTISIRFVRYSYIEVRLFWFLGCTQRQTLYHAQKAGRNCIIHKKQTLRCLRLARDLELDSFLSIPRAFDSLVFSIDTLHLALGCAGEEGVWKSQTLLHILKSFLLYCNMYVVQFYTKTFRRGQTAPRKEIATEVVKAAWAL